MRDEPFHQCPKELCRLPKWGRGKVKRLLGTGAGVIFKGSGFYSTDYRSPSYKEAAKKDAPAAADSGGEKSGTKDATSSPGKEAKAAPSESKPKKQSAA
jgi:predicted nucleic acid-binding Zn ribbon protein